MPPGDGAHMHTAHSPTLVPSAWRLVAMAYTAAGLVALAACAMLPESEVAMLAAIAGGLPGSLSLLTLDLAPGVARSALLLLAASWAANAALLWWLALRRGGPSSPLR